MQLQELDLPEFLPASLKPRVLPLYSLHRTHLSKTLSPPVFYSSINPIVRPDSEVSPPTESHQDP